MAFNVCGRYLDRRLLLPSSILRRFFSSKSDSRVVLTDDSSVVVCWHPEKFFPYEMSLPIERKTKRPGDSVLKVQSSKDLLSVLKPKRPEVVRQELMAMTHTLKHIWFPPKFQFRRKPRPPRDRPYL